MEYALDTVRLFLFLKDTQPDNVEKLQLETNPQKKAQFLNLRPFGPEILRFAFYVLSCRQCYKKETLQKYTI